MADVNGKSLPDGCQLYEEYDEKTSIRDMIGRLKNGLLVRLVVTLTFCFGDRASQ